MAVKPKVKCQKCAMYSETGLFCDVISPDELDGLSDESRTATLKRGETFSGEALTTWPIVAVATGVLSMQHLLEDGRKSIAALFMQGDIIDLRDISNRNRGHLIALSTSNVCRLSPAMFQRIMESNPDAQHVVWRNLRDQTFRAIDHSADLSKKQALEKLASFIFECRHRQARNVSENSVVIPVRRVDLAEYLGMQPETVSRCFRNLEERGIVELKSIKHVKLLSIPALRRIANGDKNPVNLRDPAKDTFKILSFG